MKEFIKDNFGYIIGFFATPVIELFKESLKLQGKEMKRICLLKKIEK